MKWLVEVTDPALKQMNERLFPVVALFIVLLVLMGAVVAAIRVRSRGERFAVIFISLSIAMGLLLTALRLFYLSSRLWSSDRLANVVLLLKGYSLYSLAQTGPIEAHIYGPFAVF